MRTGDKYNGWSNWDTWAAYLWLSNDEHSYNVCRRYAGKPSFKSGARSLINQMNNPDKIKFINVNWKEVEEAFLEE